MHDAQAEKMVSQFEEMGNVLGDLGLALIAMAKYEDEEGARTGSYTDSSAASKDISADAKRVGMVCLPLPFNVSRLWQLLCMPWCL